MLQQEIASRLNRPIDLERAAIDADDMRKRALLSNQNSLIPLSSETLQDMYPDLDEPSIADYALRAAQTRNLQTMLQNQPEGSPLSGPMIASIMQLDR